MKSRPNSTQLRIVFDDQNLFLSFPQRHRLPFQDFHVGTRWLAGALHGLPPLYWAGSIDHILLFQALLSLRILEEGVAQDVRSPRSQNNQSRSFCYL